MRLVASVLALLLVASVGVGAAQAAPPSVVVLPAKARVLDDGSVRLHLRVRCQEQQQAFEWTVDVRQGTVYGNDGDGPTAGLIACDGAFHRVRALVPGVGGPYVPGKADVQALVQLYDEDEGSDVELEDRAVVRLRAAGSGCGGGSS